MFDSIWNTFPCNYSADAKFLLDNSSSVDLNNIYKIIHGRIPFPIVICGLILNFIYIVAVIRAIRQHRVSRKCYVLLVNRASGDVLSCLFALGMAIYTMSVPIVSREAMQILDCCFISGFWSAMVSYVALSLIKLYAVWQPLNYRKWVTMRRCLYLVGISWLFFLFMACYGLAVILAVELPWLHSVTGCERVTCIRYMYKMRNAIMVIAYSVTITCFIITVILIQRARRFVSSFHQKSTISTDNSTGSTTNPRRRSLKQRFPLWKLAVNVVTFAFFNVFYAIWAVCLLINRDPCFFRSHYNGMMFLLGLIRLSLLTRIMVDPVVAFITDLQVRRSVLALFQCGAGVRPIDSKKRPFARQSQLSEENSSDADLKNLKRQSTKISHLPDRPSIKSISNNKI